MLREDVTQRCHLHLEGLGPFSISTAPNPPTALLCGSAPWVNGCLPGSRSIVLNLHTPSDGGCAYSLTPIGPMSLTTSPLTNILSITSMALSIATTGITTFPIAYKLWYVIVSGVHLIQRLTMTDIWEITQSNASTITGAMDNELESQRSRTSQSQDGREHGLVPDVNESRAP